MVVISRDIYERKIKKARTALLKAGLIAPDGSGDSDIEALFTLLRWLEKGQLIIEEKKGGKSL